MDIKDHDRDHNLTYVVSPDKLHVKMKFWVSVMMWFSSDYVFLYLINKTFALKVCLHFNLVFRCTSAEESRASSLPWLTHFITITFTIMAQRFSWVQQCTATLGVTWRSHLRSIFTHRNLLGSLTFFFSIWTQSVFYPDVFFSLFFLKKKITFIIRKSLQLLLLIYHETRPETKWVFGNLSNSNILARSFRSQVLHRILFSADMRVTVTLHALTLWSQ